MKALKLYKVDGTIKKIPLQKGYKTFTIDFLFSLVKDATAISQQIGMAGISETEVMIYSQGCEIHREKNKKAAEIWEKVHPGDDDIFYGDIVVVDRSLIAEA